MNGPEPDRRRMTEDLATIALFVAVVTALALGGWVALAKVLGL
jgi:hypothetical protein